ncbi:MAG: glycine cleavage system protein GcvH [Spirochaetia bacterium]|nr:glycine cleavage system protein GcvH [Spirochaetia bacterium]
MSEVKSELKYTKDHEWIKAEGNTIIVGITDYAQENLGDIVFVELPSREAKVNKGNSLCTIESVKAVSDVYVPASGTIIKTNEEIETDPAIINKEPYTGGWLAVIELSDSSELNSLMSADEYTEYLKTLED